MTATTMSIRCNDCGATLSHWYEDVWECVTCGKVVQEMDFPSEVALARAEAKLACTSFDQMEFPMTTTEKVKHTAGPWRVEDTPQSSNQDHLVMAGKTTVASIDYQLEHYEAWANARLIAASPEMLSALERVWDSRHEPDKWSLEVSRALEKATGQAHPFMGARELRDIHRAKGE